MEAYGVDVYLGSFPVRGARAAVEVMGSGTPALWHVESDASAYHDTHMAYPDAEVWRTPEDLAALLARADGAWLRAQARAARGHFERSHDARAPDLAAFLAGESDAARTPPDAAAFVGAPVVRGLVESWHAAQEARAECSGLRERLARLEAARPLWRRALGRLGGAGRAGGARPGARG
jgi:hypothetical protein